MMSALIVMIQQECTGSVVDGILWVVGFVPPAELDAWTYEFITAVCKLFGTISMYFVCNNKMD